MFLKMYYLFKIKYNKSLVFVYFFLLIFKNYNVSVYLYTTVPKKFCLKMPRKMMASKRLLVNKTKSYSQRNLFLKKLSSDSLVTETSFQNKNSTLAQDGYIVFNKLNIQYSRNALLWGDANPKDYTKHEEDLRDFHAVMRMNFFTNKALDFFYFCQNRNIFKYCSLMLYAAAFLHFLKLFIYTKRCLEI